MVSPPTQTHTPVPLHSLGLPLSTFYVSHSDDIVRRLIVFVHGFNGRAVSTWADFPTSGANSDWWRTSDLLFFGYDSLREDISGVAYRLRTRIEGYFPRPRIEVMEVEGTTARTNTYSPYEELILVGHSLGGLILRRAICDAAIRLTQEGEPSVLTGGKLCLFSPAIAGFRAAGFLGSMRATSVWKALEIFLRRSSAYSDLQEGSQIINSTRKRTTTLARQRSDLTALRASIVWANPDNVVLSERYSTDYVDGAWDGTTHTTVCKPKRHFEKPRLFV